MRLVQIQETLRTGTLTGKGISVLSGVVSTSTTSISMRTMGCRPGAQTI